MSSEFEVAVDSDRVEASDIRACLRCGDLRPDAITV